MNATQVELGGRTKTDVEPWEESQASAAGLDPNRIEDKQTGVTKEVRGACVRGSGAAAPPDNPPVTARFLLGSDVISRSTALNHRPDRSGRVGVSQKMQ